VYLIVFFRLVFIGTGQNQKNVNVLHLSFFLLSPFLEVQKMGVQQGERDSSALAGAFRKWKFYPSKKSNCFDLESACTSLSKKVKKRLLRMLKRRNKNKNGIGVKFTLRARLLLRKYSDDIKDYVTIDFWIPSNQSTLYQEWNLTKTVSTAFKDIFTRLDNFVHEGSGWSLRQVLELELSAASFRIVRGGCASQGLPQALRGRHGVISLDKCPKDQCFIYAVAAALANVKRNANRLSHKVYTSMLEVLPKVLKFPVKICDLRAFEKACKKVSVNVYSFENGVAFPYYISGKKRALHANLLLFKEHYYPVRNLGSLLKVNNACARRKTFVCELCLAFFINEKRFDLHKQLCKGKGPKLEFPGEDESTISFKNVSNAICAPFVVYCDLETLVLESNTANCSKKVLSTRQHTPISAGALTVCRTNSSFTSNPFIYTGADCIVKLLDWISGELLRITKVLSNTCFPMFMHQKDTEAFNSATHCAMCCAQFNNKVEKVRDHDHLNGMYRFALCNSCNLTRARTRFAVNIFFHGLSNYDSHFLIQELHRFNTDKVKVIPKTGEKYLSFSVGDAHFKDSLQFLGSSLATLASNLHTKGEKYFEHTRQFVKNRCKRKYFFQKGVFPYSYMSSLERLQDTCLPPIQCFKNDLTGQDLKVEDYKLAQKVWRVFGCETMQDYMEIYLLCDVLLLADVFENFRTNSLQDYDLDPVYYFSTPHFTLDAFLKQSKVTLDLILELEQYLFLIEGIRGGLSVVSKRYSAANHPGLGHLFDPSKPERYILYLDANNLYGKAMMQPMPIKDFAWMSSAELQLDYILSIPPDGEDGCIVECDLHYPSALHEEHCDFPLAPHRHKVRKQELSPVALAICQKHKMRGSIGSEKLMATFLPRANYVTHFCNLQLYVKLGMKVTKIHRGVKFKQAPVFKEYIEFNSKKRAAATNNFDSDFYKLLSNSLFGKTIERPEKRSRVVLTSDANKYQKLVGSPCYKTTNPINKNLVGVSLSYPCVKVKKPFYVGMSILEAAKVWMYSFHYEVMKPNFGQSLQLLYTDTDSLLYEVNCPNVYKKLKKVSSFFDFSNYPQDHFLHSLEKKRCPGLFKDEAGGKTITEFVGLRSKMYSFKIQNESEASKAAKGVKASVIKHQLQHKDYKACLFERAQLEHEFSHITSKSHSVVTALKRKISLSPFDDKRYLLNDIESVPYGCVSLDDEVETGEDEKSLH
jgi:hypothetical protein